MMSTTTSTQLSRRSRDKYVNVVDTIHVADAVADTDETYSAQAAAEKNTFTNTNNSANNANYANYANYTYYGPPKLYSITVAFQSQKISCIV